MRRASPLLAGVLVLLALIPAGAAVDTTAAGKARLRLVDPAPVTVRGTGFAAGESVSVSVRGLGGMTRKNVTAGRLGGWTVTFRNRAYQRCGGLIVSALGNRGSRAGLKLPPALCPPPPL
jgi:hypothetical protein